MEPDSSEAPPCAPSPTTCLPTSTADAPINETAAVAVDDNRGEEKTADDTPTSTSPPVVPAAADNTVLEQQQQQAMQSFATQVTSKAPADATSEASRQALAASVTSSSSPTPPLAIDRSSLQALANMALISSKSLDQSDAPAPISEPLPSPTTVTPQDETPTTNLVPNIDPGDMVRLAASAIAGDTIVAELASQQFSDQFSPETLIGQPIVDDEAAAKTAALAFEPPTVAPAPPTPPRLPTPPANADAPTDAPSSPPLAKRPRTAGYRVLEALQDSLPPVPNSPSPLSPSKAPTKPSVLSSPAIVITTTTTTTAAAAAAAPAASVSASGAPSAPSIIDPLTDGVDASTLNPRFGPNQPRCQAKNQRGGPCGKAPDGTGFCSAHRKHFNLEPIRRPREKRTSSSSSPSPISGAANVVAAAAVALVDPATGLLVAPPPKKRRRRPPPPSTTSAPSTDTPAAEVATANTSTTTTTPMATTPAIPTTSTPPTSSGTAPTPSTSDSSAPLPTGATSSKNTTTVTTATATPPPPTTATTTTTNTSTETAPAPPAPARPPRKRAPRGSSSIDGRPGVPAERLGSSMIVYASGINCHHKAIDLAALAPLQIPLTPITIPDVPRRGMQIAERVLPGLCQVLEESQVNAKLQPSDGEAVRAMVCRWCEWPEEPPSAAAIDYVNAYMQGCTHTLEQELNEANQTMLQLAKQAPAGQDSEKNVVALRARVRHTSDEVLAMERALAAKRATLLEMRRELAIAEQNKTRLDQFRRSCKEQQERASRLSKSAELGQQEWQRLVLGSESGDKALALAESNTVLALWDTVCVSHQTGHYDRPDRLFNAVNAVVALQKDYPEGLRLSSHVNARFTRLAEERVKLMHEPRYLHRLRTVCAEATDAPRMITERNTDTFVNRESYRSALTAVGNVLEATSLVVRGLHSSAFSVVRPPGHHAGYAGVALHADSQGFCLFNNVALGAVYAHDVLRVKRVTVIDIDVHHGNGTEELLMREINKRPREQNYQFISIHVCEEGIYPNTVHERADKHPNVLNFPLPAAYEWTRDVLGTGVMDRVREAMVAFEPELVMISAGFDAHKDDWMALASFNSTDFYAMTRSIVDIAESISSCAGVHGPRIVSVFEGGYGKNPEDAPEDQFDAYRDAVGMHLRALLSKTDPVYEYRRAAEVRQADLAAAAAVRAELHEDEDWGNTQSLKPTARVRAAAERKRKAPSTVANGDESASDDGGESTAVSPNRKANGLEADTTTSPAPKRVRREEDNEEAMTACAPVSRSRSRSRPRKRPTVSSSTTATIATTTAEAEKKKKSEPAVSSLVSELSVSAVSDVDMDNDFVSPPPRTDDSAHKRRRVTESSIATKDKAPSTTTTSTTALTATTVTTPATTNSADEPTSAHDNNNNNNIDDNNNDSSGSNSTVTSDDSAAAAANADAVVVPDLVHSSSMVSTQPLAQADV